MSQQSHRDVVLCFDPANESQPFDYYLDCLEAAGIDFETYEVKGNPLVLMYENYVYQPATAELSGQDGIMMIIDILRVEASSAMGLKFGKPLEEKRKISETMRRRHREKMTSAIDQYIKADATHEGLWSLELNTGELVVIPANG